MSTSLPRTIPRVAWKDGFGLGVGVNVETGDNAAKPFVETGTHATTNIDEEQRVIALSNNALDGYERLLTLMGSCDVFNLAPLSVSLGGFASVTSTIRARESTLTYIVYYKSTSNIVAAKEPLQLRDDAHALALSNPAQFRATYGDYFVAGVRQGALFVAVVSVTTVEREKRSTISAGLDVDLKVCSMADAAKADKVVSESRASLDIAVWTTGLKADAYDNEGAPALNELQDFVGVSKAIEWFKRHKAGVDQDALLNHYSILPELQTIPNQLPINPAAFKTIQSIRVVLLKCRVRMSSLPDSSIADNSPVETLRRRLGHLGFSINSDQAILPTTPALCADYLTQLNQLDGELTEVHAVYAIFQKVRKHVELEPGGAYEIALRDQWSFGLTKINSSQFVRIELGEEKKITVAGGPFASTQQERILRIQPKENEHIVGWQVVPNHRHSTGKADKWRKHSQSVILSRTASIKCAMPSMTEFHSRMWTLRTFVVANNPIFDAFYRSSSKLGETLLVTDEAAPVVTP